MHLILEILSILSIFLLSEGTPQNDRGSSMTKGLQGTTAVNVSDAEIKEFHFHVYFFQTSMRSVTEARQLWYKVQQRMDEGHFVVGRGRFHERPVGPHLIGNYEIWCPIEYFGKVYSFLLLNRGTLSILIHPLTTMEFLDHTDRAAWIGKPLPLDEEPLCEKLYMNPSQYHGMCLGYSSETCLRPYGLTYVCAE